MRRPHRTHPGVFIANCDRRRLILNIVRVHFTKPLYTVELAPVCRLNINILRKFAARTAVMAAHLASKTAEYCPIDIMHRS